MNTFGKLGYEVIFFLLGLGFVVLFFYPPLKYSPAKGDKATETCVYNPPVSSVNFTDQGKTYELIKSRAAIVMGQVLPHLENSMKIVKVNGQDRKVYSVLRGPDGSVGASTWLTDGDTSEDWAKVRFVDISDTISDRTPGNRYFDIYIEKGNLAPKFAIRHCAENPTEEKYAISDQSDNSFPPKEIDISKISGWSCPPGRSAVESELCNKFINEHAPRSGIYYLYAYDTDSNEIVKGDNRNGYNPRSQLPITYNGTTQNYQVVYFGGFESRHIRLVTDDPKYPGTKIGYRYANPERLTSPVDPYVFLNKQETSTETLQLQAFTPWKIPPAGWWTPECKPAIYLYPKTTMNVNVKVNPKGHFTYTDPIYDGERGWNVKAYPSGKLEWLDNVYGINSKGEKRQTNIYDYLYYESKIHDSMIDKPEEGFVVKYEDLENFYRTTLPKLGLNEQETKDYIDYWIKVLPSADYYFIGLLSEQNVNEIEPMEITPAPHTTVRIRLYYESLSTQKAAQKKKIVNSPQLENKYSREGFTVVEWGGMVKQDKGHPFTCSM